LETGVELFEPKKEIGGIIGARGRANAPSTGKTLKGTVDFGEME